MIPKIVHYCWFGHNEKPDLICKCIASWHKYLPDWEFMEWNEDNYDVNAVQYTREAYVAQKWAYVADYARFDVLNRYGGVYFDTDVELLKTIPEDMLEQQAFTGFQSNNRVAPGLVYGSEKGQVGLKHILGVYDKWIFGLSQDNKPQNVLDAFSEAFIPFGLKLNGEFQVVEGIAIYPSEFFCCYDFETLSFDIKPETVSVHYYYASWISRKERVRQNMVRFLVKLLGPEKYKMIKYKLISGRESN